MAENIELDIWSAGREDVKGTDCIQKYLDLSNQTYPKCKHSKYLENIDKSFLSTKTVLVYEYTK